MGEPIFAVRGSNGLIVYQGTKQQTTLHQQLFDRKQLRESGQVQLQIKCHLFSSDGRYYAYCDGERTVVLRTNDWQPQLILDGIHGKTSAVHFSPNSNYFCTWQVLYGTAASQQQQAKPSPNLFVFDLNTKKLFAEFVDKNRNNWQPHWTQDEAICVRLLGSELLFHENNNLEKYSHKLVVPKMVDYSLSSVSNPLHVAAYVPIGKDTPAVVRVFRYPEFKSAVAAKTFFKADRVSMQWNKKGTALIIMAIIDIDSTGQSYYGEQNLYFVSTNGDSYMVPLAKNGPVYCVEWSPNSSQYCVVYGYMPAKATLYNLKGDVVFDFGTGPRNEAHYDPFGKVLCICGFGNLRGNMEFWNLGATVADKKRVSQFKAEDTTVFRWCPDGQHFLTATTAPRLRVNNGWKIWKYDGSIVAKFDTPAGEELWDVVWRPDATLTEKSVLTSQVPVASSPNSNDLVLPGVNKSGAYVPPHMRGVANKPVFKLHELELASNEKLAAEQTDSNLSKQALKNRRRQENKKGKPHEEHPFGRKIDPEPNQSVVADTDAAEAGGDIEKDKKIKNLNKKLEQIALLKEKAQKGEKLELNQLEKIDKETQLRDELDALRLS